MTVLDLFLFWPRVWLSLFDPVPVRPKDLPDDVTFLPELRWKRRVR